MFSTSQALLALTAADLMTREVVRLPEDMPLRDAVKLLLRNQVGGAPVVDTQGRCVGVLSVIDVLRQTEKGETPDKVTSPPSPFNCPFQIRHRRSDGREVTLCTLAPGVCPMQVRQAGPAGEALLVCSEPHCVLTDWQIADVENLPDDEVRRFMTPNPVTAPPETALRTLARRMVDAHIHRIIVVDGDCQPIGVVSSTDLLAALARSNGSS
jgi:CBS domain-containing protein